MQDDSGSSARVALDRDITAKLGREPSDLAQPESGSLERLPRREERLENTGQNVGCDSFTGIDHFKPNEVARCAYRARRASERVEGSQDQHATLWHRVGGVRQEIEERKLEIIGEVTLLLGGVFQLWRSLVLLYRI